MRNGNPSNRPIPCIFINCSTQRKEHEEARNHNDFSYKPEYQPGII